MERRQIITELKKFFKIQELICPHILGRWGEQSWRFFHTAFLETLLIIRRDILQSGMTCNNYHVGGTMSQRGIRCNLCQMTRDATSKNQLATLGHPIGAAGDFTVTGMTAQEARSRISANADKLPYPIRLEDGVNWLHFDVLDTMNGQKITLFKP